MRTYFLVKPFFQNLHFLLAEILNLLFARTEVKSKILLEVEIWKFSLVQKVKSKVLQAEILKFGLIQKVKSQFLLVQIWKFGLSTFRPQVTGKK